MNQKVIIVGGVAGGASTAARLRRLDEHVDIVLIEKGEYISFANCGLPYYIGDIIDEREKLLVQTIEGMCKRFKLDIRNLTEVIDIYKEEKKIRVRNNQTGEVYDEYYDLLVLSPGAQPIMPHLEGIEQCSNLFTLRSIPDTDRIKSYIHQNSVHSAVVIGGGFIGLEMVENLHHQGIHVTLVEASNQIMANLDREMIAPVQTYLEDKGIEVILKDGIRGIKESGRKVVLTSGVEIETDMIVMAIGVAPETYLAKQAGLELTTKGAIVVNEYMQTSDASIYALGDAVAVHSLVNNMSIHMPLAGPANRQGRTVADHIIGKKTPYKGVLGSSVAKVFDYTVATTGFNEKILKQLGFIYQSVHIHPNSHAGYYPGAVPIALKLLFNPESGEIFGAQGVGLEGVEKRIDVIATAIKGGLTVYDLQDIELCYAPPYNSAKDPVNMLGYYATNIIDGLVETVQAEEVDTREEQILVLDVREPFEVQTGSIPGAINIPLGQLRMRVNELPQNQLIYVTCKVGLRGYIACRILKQLGYECKNIDGGMVTYTAIQDKDNKQKKMDSLRKEEKVDRKSQLEGADVTLNTCGLQCPGPIKKVFEKITDMEDGETLKVVASDPGFTKDIQAWCESTHHTLIEQEWNEKEKTFTAYIQKGNQDNRKKSEGVSQTDAKAATLVVFSGDLDKAIASFIIATGAASMGKEVTMFFTFWGLNILKRKDRPKVDKDTMEKMFDIMLPSHTGKLGLSKMNMGGMGSTMIKQIMKKHHVEDLDTLIKNAVEMGVKLVACTMSMELMGIKQEEFVGGVELGGVAAYLGAAEQSGLNLFI